MRIILGTNKKSSSMQKIQELISPLGSDGIPAIRQLILKLANAITSKYLLTTISSERHGSIPTVDVVDMFVDFRNYEPSFSLTDALETSCSSHTVSLKDAGILAFPWDRERLPWMFRDFHVSGFEWRQDPNHSIVLLKPFNIYLVAGGNHSIACGCLFSTGSVECREAVDFSKVLNEYSFDGEYFWNREPRRLNRPILPEFGQLFELGKLIQLNAE